MLGHSSVVITQKVFAAYLGDNSEIVDAYSSLIDKNMKKD